MDKSAVAAEQHFREVCKGVCSTARDKPGDMLSALCVALELVKADRALRHLDREPMK